MEAWQVDYSIDGLDSLPVAHTPFPPVGTPTLPMMHIVMVSRVTK